MSRLRSASNAATCATSASDGFASVTQRLRRESSPQAAIPLVWARIGHCGRGAVRILGGVWRPLLGGASTEPRIARSRCYLSSPKYPAPPGP
jgi:hypothetical protein